MNYELKDDRILITLIVTLFYAFFLQNFSGLVVARAVALVLFLSLFPGYILLRFFDFKEIDKVELLFLSVGLSVFVVIVAGLVINFLPIQQPLRPEITFTSITVLVLALTWSKKGITRKFRFPPNIDWMSESKVTSLAFFLLSITVIYATVIGVNVLNSGGPNDLVLVIPLVLACYMLFSSLLFRKENSGKYLIPVALYTVSLSLLFIYSLRSAHVMGADVHLEISVFNKVVSSLQWNFWSERLLFTAPYMGCLSITLYPAMLSTISQLSGETLFKILYPCILSLAPLITYYAFQEKFDRILAYAAALFFMFHGNYITESHAMLRMLMGILFFALLIYSVMRQHGRRRVIFSSVFLFGLIVSHYSTAYAATSIFALAFVGCYIMLKFFRISANTYLRYISLLLIIGIFYWFDQFLETGVFTVVTLTVYEGLASASIFPIGGKLQAIFPSVPPLDFWGELVFNFNNFYSNLVRIFILLGFTKILLNLRKDHERETLEMLFLAGASLSIVALNLILGPEKGLTIFRTYQISTLMLSPMLVYGFYYASDKLLRLFRRARNNDVCTRVRKDKAIGIALVIFLIGQLLLTSDFLWQVSGHNRSIYMNDFETAAQYGYAGGASSYVTEEEVIVAKWIGENLQDTNIWSDVYGAFRLFNYGQLTSETVKILIKGLTLYYQYVFLRYEVVKYNKLPLIDKETGELSYISLDSIKMTNTVTVFEAGDVKVLRVDVLTTPST